MASSLALGEMARVYTIRSLSMSWVRSNSSSEATHTCTPARSVPIARVLALRINARHCTRNFVSIVWIRIPILASQTKTRPLAPPAATAAPSGETAIAWNPVASLSGDTRTQDNRNAATQHMIGTAFAQQDEWPKSQAIRELYLAS